MRRALVLFALSVALLSGCSTSNPVQPVDSVPLDSLALFPDSAMIEVGDSRAFSVSARDTSGAVVTNPVVTWRSRNSGVFTINSSGVVRAVGEGSAYVVASSGGLSDSSLVTVLPATRGWFTQVSNTSFALQDVFADAGGNRAWAVGANGRIQATSDAGATWTGQVSNTGNTLYGVWFTSASEGWAVGDDGTVRYTVNGGASWQIVLAGTSEALYDVHFATRDHGWIVGSNGVIARTRDRGETWTRKFPTGFSLRSVAFSDTSNGWAVGDGGVIVGTRDGGSSWYIVQPAITTQGLRGVSRRFVPPPPTAALARGGASPARAQSLFDFAIAVGAQGVTPRAIAGADSAVWELRNSGAINQLQDVHLVDVSTGWAVGDNGTTGLILRTDNAGTSWTPQTSGTGFPLNGVHFIDRNRGWAVGGNGAIVHTVTGGRP